MTDLDDEAAFWRDQRAAAGGPHPVSDPGRRDWFDTTRVLAESEPCTDCGAHPGETCTIVGTIPPQPLRKFPAHTRRWNRALAKAAR